ncbi:Hydroxymethylglutaryl-CoA synthase, cytoplasmic [Pteropus alecto]|uniref:Hydroxymethylglutaryl-CoA synthase, cytoplasmic n=1 Tax=Pteropus alecto TaxID=9402 RepID=L5KFZ1_PTEAL|nr:Hydroxymethylglutaryl-CoA synthase, cytoplasmic [Pteropus alecto]
MENSPYSGYLSALDRCYSVYYRKIHAQWQKEGNKKDFTLNGLGFMLFYSPYYKLVRKSLARMLLSELLNDQNRDKNSISSGPDAFGDVKLENTSFDRDAEKVFTKASSELFNQKTKASLLVSNQNRDMYTSSVDGSFASVLARYSPQQPARKDWRVLLWFWFGRHPIRPYKMPHRGLLLIKQQQVYVISNQGLTQKLV